MPKLRKAVFPVAGFGSRFLPVTKASPKEMMPVVDKPLIQYAVEEAAAAGITDMIFVTGRHKRAIEDHFDKAYELETELERKGKEALLQQVRSVLPEGVRCIYIRQPEPLGLGHAVLCAQPVVGDDPFAELLAAVTPGAGGEIQLTDAISAMLSHERALAVRLPGRRFDCGSKLGYLQATVELGVRHPEVGAAFTRYLKSR